MNSKSTARELALLALGQISDGIDHDIQSLSLDLLMQRALESLLDHWREGLDTSAQDLENAHQKLLDSELEDFEKKSLDGVRLHLKEGLVHAEKVLNSLSVSLEMPRLFALSNDPLVKKDALTRIRLVIEERSNIDVRLDQVMEGWRLHRLPRIDRDILRLTVVDLINLQTPPAVACNEAVDLANRYSDDQGRRMINGILRRFQNSSFLNPT